MSFEGFYRYLCPKGHYWEKDCYDDIEICPYCSEKFKWSELIDTTNGLEDGEEDYPMTKLKEKDFEKIKHTDDFGNNYYTKRYLYKIPRKRKS